MNALLAAALASALLSGAGTWWITSAFDERAALKLKAENDKKIEAANERADNAASDYEVWASLQRPKTITVTREVEREIKADLDCSARPLPAGLRDALVRAGADAAQPVADGGMPAAPAARAFELGRPGAGVPGDADGAAGLRSPAQSPR